jgi:hypothetical protein
MTKYSSIVDDRPGNRIDVGPAPPEPKAEIVQGDRGPSFTGVMAFGEVLKRFRLIPLNRSRQARRLRSPAELRHDEFLSRVCMATETGRPLVSPATAEHARAIWEVVRRNAEIRVPAASVAMDGTILYAWDSGDHHLEVEIGEGKPAEWMYVHRQNGETWFASQNTTDLLPPEVLTRLRSVE